MAKKDKNVEVVNENIEAGERPESAFEKADRLLASSNLYEALAEGLSMRKLSEVSGVSYAKLLRLSHAPISGELYDPEKLNAPAVARCVVINMDQDAFVAIDFMQVVEEMKAAGGFGQSTGKVTVIPEVGNQVYFTRPGASKSFAKHTTYNVLLVNEAFVVLQEDADNASVSGEYLTTKLSTANNMGLKIGIAPAAEIATGEGQDSAE